MQRAVLARELAGEDQRADRRQPGVRPRLRRRAPRSTPASLQVRAKGGAVLLVSEDLDELLELSDRIAVMSEGRIVFETPAAGRRPAHDRRAHGRRRTMATAAPASPVAQPRRRPHDDLRLAATPFEYPFAARRGRRWSSSTCSATSSSPAASAPRSATTSRCCTPAIAPIAALLAAWRARGWPIVHTREAHQRRPRPTARRPSACAATPSLRIGDPGPMGRVLIAGEPGADIIPALAPQRRRDRDRQARQGHVLGHRPARDRCRRAASPTWSSPA